MRALRLVGVLLAAIAVGIGAAFACAFLVHAGLVAAVGEDGIAPLDDTMLMRTLVMGCYVAGLAAGTVVLVLGWRRFVRSPRPT